ncbi:POZ [Glarea lozoyensis ATCC 20868]|uniref:POZ n=1 Tax=Glarea lozoyensis (strain ATCC 20868 / MF5171) TaxID=1116229 RepID=S3CSV5_GLAL2|nr:POZ [Glarea lozoyensis ATCC 20868]EPE28740.1 POZ [Glarea lozoyensis ATCC 20868]
MAQPQRPHHHHHRIPEKFENPSTPKMSTSPGSVSNSEHTPSESSQQVSTVMSTPPIYIASPIPQTSTPGLHASLLTGKFSDLTITHGTTTWSAHKVIICAQSPYLEAEIAECIVSRASLSQSASPEEEEKDLDGRARMELRRARMPRCWNAPPRSRAEPAVLDLSDDPLDAVTQVITYLYTATYTLPPSPPRQALETNIAIHTLAGKYRIPSLQAFAAAQFKFVMNTELKDIDIFFELVKVIYAEEGDGATELREAVVEAAVTEMDMLLVEGRMRFFAALSANWTFLGDVLGVMRERGKGEEERVGFLCEGCG